MEPVQIVPAGHPLVCPGDRPTSSTLLIRGLCARFNLLHDGSRSVTQISVAGDFIDLHSLLMTQMDHGIVAVSECAISKVPHDRIIAVTTRHPHLARLLWLDTTIDAAIHRQWLHRMGTQDAVGRLAHLICEIETRLEVVDEAGPDGFEFPLTQIDLADCLGLSAVHVNRTLMTLRRRELVEWRGGRVRILDRARLWALAEFDPVYLRLEAGPV
ncbi:Crp/Fnr family transcriptional regulator [Brevundimonas bacteroides]|uniref:Crp/Fnr family transcriptional regulator n=1 Tax=Brevundimonas bacteroides TaxID=74311 RepID=UPI000A7F95F5|nr:Crp/Fnr family transcriptional regulator [Brevundimonas bacteroides]